MRLKLPLRLKHIMNMRIPEPSECRKFRPVSGYACATFARSLAANPLQMQQTAFEAIQPTIAADAMPGRADEIAERDCPMSLAR